MLLHDDVVAHGEAKSGAFARRLSREEWIEYLFFYLRRNARAVVADTDFHRVAETFRCSQQRWLKPWPAVATALGRGIKAIRDQIKKRARDFLRKQFGCTRA